MNESCSSDPSRPQALRSRRRGHLLPDRREVRGGHVAGSVPERRSVAFAGRCRHVDDVAVLAGVAAVAADPGALVDQQPATDWIDWLGPIDVGVALVRLLERTAPPDFDVHTGDDVDVLYADALMGAYDVSPAIAAVIGPLAGADRLEHVTRSGLRNGRRSAERMNPSGGLKRQTSAE